MIGLNSPLVFEYIISCPMHITRKWAEDTYKIALPKERVEISAFSYDNFEKFKGLEYSVGNFIKNTVSKILSDKLPCQTTNVELLSITTRENGNFVFKPSMITTTEYYFDKDDDVDPDTIWNRMLVCLKNGVPKDWEVNW